MTFDQVVRLFREINELSSISETRARLMELPLLQRVAVISYAYGRGRQEPWEFFARVCVME